MKKKTQNRIRTNNSPVLLAKGFIHSLLWKGSTRQLHLYILFSWLAYIYDSFHSRFRFPSDDFLTAFRKLCIVSLFMCQNLVDTRVWASSKSSCSECVKNKKGAPQISLWLFECATCYSSKNEIYFEKKERIFTLETVHWSSGFILKLGFHKIVMINCIG